MISKGKTEYAQSHSRVIASGISHSITEYKQAISGPVASLVFDQRGTKRLTALLSGVSDTGFQVGGLTRVLDARRRKPEAWRVGEAYAEAYLTAHRACFFPWPDGRDERKSGSSLPGADLVGFRYDETKSAQFAFGEVKTSHENRYPPGSMYGRTGLRRQLGALKNRESLRDDLMLYLGHRAGRSSWESEYRTAAKRYLANSTDVSLFGVLVRDVEPDERDLSGRFRRLCQRCPTSMAIELTAIYLPASSITAMPDDVMPKTKGGTT